MGEALIQMPCRERRRSKNRSELCDFLSSMSRKNMGRQFSTRPVAMAFSLLLMACKCLLLLLAERWACSPITVDAQLSTFWDSSEVSTGLGPRVKGGGARSASELLSFVLVHGESSQLCDDLERRRKPSGTAEDLYSIVVASKEGNCDVQMPKSLLRNLVMKASSDSFQQIFYASSAISVLQESRVELPFDWDSLSRKLLSSTQPNGLMKPLISHVEPAPGPSAFGMAALALSLEQRGSGVPPAEFEKAKLASILLLKLLLSKGNSFPMALASSTRAVLSLARQSDQKWKISEWGMERKVGEEGTTHPLITALEFMANLIASPSTTQAQLHHIILALREASEFPIFGLQMQNPGSVRACNLIGQSISGLSVSARSGDEIVEFELMDKSTCLYMSKKPLQTVSGRLVYNVKIPTVGIVKVARLASANYRVRLGNLEVFLSNQKGGNHRLVTDMEKFPRRIGAQQQLVIELQLEDESAGLPVAPQQVATLISLRRPDGNISMLVPTSMILRSQQFFFARTGKGFRGVLSFDNRSRFLPIDGVYKVELLVAGQSVKNPFKRKLFETHVSYSSRVKTETAPVSCHTSDGMAEVVSRDAHLFPKPLIHHIFDPSPKTAGPFASFVASLLVVLFPWTALAYVWWGRIGANIRLFPSTPLHFLSLTLLMCQVVALLLYLSGYNLMQIAPTFALLTIMLVAIGNRTFSELQALRQSLDANEMRAAIDLNKLSAPAESSSDSASPEIGKE